MAAASATDRVRVGDEHTAQVYAEALLRAAEQAGQLSEVTEDFSYLIDDVFANQPQVESLLGNVIVTVTKKNEIIEAAFGGKLAPIFVNFLHVLNHHGRLSLLRGMYREMLAFLDERAKRRRVYVESAAPLTDEQRQQLILTLKKRMLFEPTLVETVNPDLLGGFVVRVLDYRFDGSVRTQLDKLRKHLLERSSYEIQSRRDRFSSANGN